MVGEDQEKVVDELFLIDGHTVSVTAVSMGNPHVIMFVDAIQEAPVEELGPKMEKDERFPDWVNVEFVEVVSKNEIHFRVWERGSGITQACGTGACAAVVASVLNGYSQKGQEVTVHLLGGDLMITWQENGHVIMRGAAEVICEGVFERK
jgi:diaminopimelate epimerase